MNQSKKYSIIESLANTASGYVISTIVWIIIAPLYGINYTITKNMGITLIFTIVSIARNYVWRRIFNKIKKETI